MKNIDQKLNKKHLSFLVACLCSTIFFNDSPSWGMDVDREDPRGIKRSATDTLTEETQRPTKKQRIENRSKVNAWLTTNFENNPVFLEEGGIQKLVSFCMGENLKY